MHAPVQFANETQSSTPGRFAAVASAALWGRILVCVFVVVWAAAVVIGFTQALAILTLIGFGAAILGLRYPALGLLGMSTLCTLDPVSKLLLLNTGGLFRWNTFNYWLVIVILLHIPFLLRVGNIQIRLFELFILLLTLEVAVSPNRALGSDVILGIFTMLGLLVYFARVGLDRSAWYWLGVVNGTLAAGGGLLFYLQQSRLPEVDPNQWFFFSLTAIFALCLAVPFAPTRRAELLLIVLALINEGWVFLSGSRSGLLLALTCLFFLVISMRGLSNYVLLLILGFLVWLVISTQFADLQTQTIERFETLFSSSKSLRLRTSGRSELLLGGWQLFLRSPLGVGTGGFAMTWAGLGNVEGLTSYALNSEKAAHAGWLKILVENGVPGMLLLVGYVLSFAAVGWSKRNRTMLILGSMVTVVLCFAFTAVELQWGKGVWFLAAAATFLLHHEQIAASLRGAVQREPIDNIVYSGRTAG